jgi:hypothetical protein
VDVSLRRSYVIEVARTEDSTDQLLMNGATTWTRTWFKALLDPLRGPGWRGNSVLLGSTPPTRDTTVSRGVFFKGVVCQKKSLEMVLRVSESIFFAFS